MMKTKLIVDVEHKVGDIIYIITDDDQRKGIVVGYQISNSIHNVVYIIMRGTYQSMHYGMELTVEKNILINN